MRKLSEFMHKFVEELNRREKLFLVFLLLRFR